MVLQQTVGEVMSAPVLTVTPATPLKDAVTLLSDHHISGVPVVGDDGERCLVPRGRLATSSL